MMRLLFLDEAPFIGGAEQFLIDLIVRLDRSFEPTVVVEQSSDAFRRRLTERTTADVRPIRLHPFQRPSGLRQAATEVGGLVGAMARLTTVVRATNPELIVVNSHLGVLTALPVARLLRRPLLWIVHYSKLGSDAVAGDRVVRQLVGAVDGGAAVSDALRADFVAAVPAAAERWRFIPNGIDVDAFAEVAAPVDDGLVKFVCVGRLTAAKGQALLLKALAQLDETEPILSARLRLELVGTGDSEPELRALAERFKLTDRVRFAGYQSDIRPALGRSDALVLPSLVETYPLALLEAMAAGRPVVATETSAVPQIAGNRPWARLVPTGDVPALAAALSQIARTDPTERRRLGALARREAEEHHRIERMIADYERLFLTYRKPNHV